MVSMNTRDFVSALLTKALGPEFDDSAGSADGKLLDAIIGQLPDDSPNPYSAAIAFLVASYSSIAARSGSYSFGADKVDESKIPAAVSAMIAYWHGLETDWNSRNGSFFDFVDGRGTYSDRMERYIGGADC